MGILSLFGIYGMNGWKKSGNKCQSLKDVKSHNRLTHLI